MIIALLISIFYPSIILAQSPYSSDPYTIYDRARSVWNAQAYPRYVDFTVVVIVEQDNAFKTNAYASEYDLGANKGHVSKLSDEQLADPTTPHGLDLKVVFILAFGKVVPGVIPTPTVEKKLNRDPVEDPLGIPLLSPIYTFGMRSTLPLKENHFGNEMPIIATVGANNRDYTVTLQTEEPYAGHIAYHLLLQPLKDPSKYRIRELWIDTTSYITLKAVINGNFTNKPETQVPWTVTFQTVDGLQYIDKETANAPLFYAKKQIYTQAAIVFQSIHAKKVPLVQFMLPQMPITGALREPPFLR